MEEREKGIYDQISLDPHSGKVQSSQDMSTNLYFDASFEGGQRGGIAFKVQEAVPGIGGSRGDKE